MRRCRQGHPLQSDDDYVPSLLARGQRRCRRCYAEYQKEYKARKRRAAGIYQRGAKPVCPKGHPLVAGNLKGGGRECLTCHRERELERARARGVQPVTRATVCSRGHDLTLPGARRPGRSDCAVCHRLRHLAPSGVEYAPILLADPCSYCGAPAEHVDHVVPFAGGGSGEWDNLTAACAPCNQRKRTKPLLVFLATAIR